MKMFLFFLDEEEEEEEDKEEEDDDSFLTRLTFVMFVVLFNWIIIYQARTYIYELTCI